MPLDLTGKMPPSFVKSKKKPMAAPLFYKTIVSFYQVKLLARFENKRMYELDEESVVITCKPPSGMTRQERYERIKALMSR